MASVTAQLEALREQHEAARLQYEISQLENQLRLQESTSNLIDPMWQFMDDYGRPTVPAGYLADRHDGANDPVFRTEEELRSIRGTARIISDRNTYVVGALANLTNYVVGTGYTYKATPKRKLASEFDPVAKVVQTVIDEFYEESHWDQWERELFRRSRRDGEYFLHFTRQQAGRTAVRTIEPEQVTESGQHPIQDDLDTEPMSWSFGIHTPERDVMDVHGYSTIWDFEYEPEYVPESQVQHVKINVDRNVKRGLSDFYPVGEEFEAARKLMRNARDGAAIQAAIAFLQEYPPGTQKTTVQSQISGTTDWTQSRFSQTSGRTLDNVRHYDPGSILRVSSGIQYKEGPLASGAQNFMTVLQGALRACAVRWSMPEAMISGDASNANFASSLVAEAPFTKAVEAAQWFYACRFREVMWKVIENAAVFGRFQHLGVSLQEIKQAVTVDVTTPPAEVRDKSGETTRRQALNTAGVLSRKTWSALEELDHEVEQENLSNEPVAPQGAGGSPPPPAPSPESLRSLSKTMFEGYP